MTSLDLEARFARVQQAVRSMMMMARHAQPHADARSARRLAILEQSCFVLGGELADIPAHLKAEIARINAELAEAQRVLQLALDAAEAVATRNGVFGALADAQAAGVPCDLVDDMSGLRVIYDPARDRRPHRPGDLGVPVYQPDRPAEHLRDMAVPAAVPIGQRWPGNVVHLPTTWRRPSIQRQLEEADAGPGGVA